MAGRHPPRETPLDNPRTWIEFTDPAEPAQRLRCDLTWLTSSYACIFAAGCLGIDRHRPHDGCCALGAHLTDHDDLVRVRDAVTQLTPDDWQLHQHSTGPDGWWEDSDDLTEDDETELTTRLVDGACILLNRADHPGGPGCALHQYAQRHGLPPHSVKPDVCWQLPLRRTYRTVTLPDDTEYLEISIGEYDRRGWGPGGHDLHWYCTGSALSHHSNSALYLSCAAELIELIGRPAYDELHRLITAHPGIITYPATTVAHHPPAPTTSAPGRTPR
ncbi:hypothetical protein [Austwickia sp. TVS 96-490-7B]|uniref:hypothetical protein n=1 Tax=Austwickia sp. TVS 96-490-7B TaxID=2830843 RepID=UPI001C571ED5|nr:hypothetical protein [Austwickia sp. TVS 96-490-7B]